MSEQKKMTTTSRQDFDITWLTEAPQGLGNFGTYEGLEYSIKELVKHGAKAQSLTDSLRKIELQQTLYYWYEDSKGTILLGVILERRPQGLIVSLTGKHPAYRGKPPFASDMYIAILHDNKTSSIRLMSDESLSDEGKALWDRLFAQGNHISVYDKSQPGKTFKTFSSKEEMDSYFQHDNTDYKRYQYVLSDNTTLLETTAFFHIRRHREFIPGLL